jgi:hypothetical protein
MQRELDDDFNLISCILLKGPPLTALLLILFSKEKAAETTNQRVGGNREETKARGSGRHAVAYRLCLLI